MERVSNIHYKGIDIIYSDFSNLKSIEEITKVFEDGSEIISNSPLKSVYALTNFDNMFFNTKVMRVIQETLKINKPHIKNTAVIGITGLSKIMFDGIIRLSGRDLRLFDTMEEAKEFLYQKSNL